MRRSHIVGLIFVYPAGFFVLSNVFPYAYLLLVYLTLGLAGPLYSLNTVFLYLLAASPALACVIKRPRYWGFAACAAVLIPIVAVVPPMISERQSFAHAEQILNDDINAGLSETPKSIELIGDARKYFGRRTLLGDAPCEELCQRLLLSRQVDLVRVKPDDAARAVHGMDYVLEKRPKLCPDAFEDGVAMLQETRDAIVSGTCFVAQEPGPGAASIAARVEIRKRRIQAPQDLVADLSRVAVTGLQTLKISVAEPGGWSLTLKKTEVTFSHWAMPLFLAPAECINGDICSHRPVFGSVVHTLNGFEPNALALRTLGIKQLDASRRLSPAARVMAMLDRTGSYFASAEKGLVTAWVKSVSCETAPCEPVKGEDEAVLQRLLTDPRTSYFLGQILSHEPRFVTANLDSVLGEMTRSGANGPFSSAVGATVARLDIEKLRARRDRIMPLIRDNDWKSARGIGILAGRLGVDTSDLISERLGRRESAATAAAAACMADVTVGQKLVPALLDHLRMTTASGSPDRSAISALIRFGHFEEIKDIARAATPKLAEKYAERRSDAEIVDDISLCDSN